MNEQIKSLMSGESTMVIKRDIICLVDNVESESFRGGINDSDPTPLDGLVTLLSPRA